MYMTRSTIIDNVWAEAVLAMVQVQKSRPTSILAGESLHKPLAEPPTLDCLRVLGYTVYVQIHEED